MDALECSIKAVAVYMKKLQQEELDEERLMGIILQKGKEHQKNLAIAETLYQLSKDALALGMPRRALLYAVCMKKRLDRMRS